MHALRAQRKFFFPSSSQLSIQRSPIRKRGGGKVPKIRLFLDPNSLMPRPRGRPADPLPHSPIRSGDERSGVQEHLSRVDDEPCQCVPTSRSGGPSEDGANICRSNGRVPERRREAARVGGKCDKMVESPSRPERSRNPDPSMSNAALWGKKKPNQGRVGMPIAVLSQMLEPPWRVRAAGKQKKKILAGAENM